MHRPAWLVGALLALAGSASGGVTVAPDRTATFTLEAPLAREVWLDGGAILRAVDPADTRQAMPLQRESGGRWSLTVGPLPPDLYAYTFTVDGVRTVDPENPAVQVNAGPPASEFEIPGDQPWLGEFAGPRGTVTRHVYAGVDEVPREVFVYTPPDYAPAVRTYPLLVLLGGNGQHAGSWATTGHLPRIADRLLAAGRMVPMVIAMPDAHAADADAFRAELRERLLPYLSRHYALTDDRRHRAIAGLSLGARRAEDALARDRDLFSSFGLLSGGGPDFAVTHADLLGDAVATNENLDLLLLATGEGDTRPYRRYADAQAALTAAGVRHVWWHDSPERHNWHAWRPAVAEALLPRLFLPATPSPRHVIYRTTESRPLELRLFLPERSPSGPPRPAIVFFFGGGFWTWNVDQFQPQAEYFARRGLVTVLVDYRTGQKDGTKPTAAFEDARSALRWLRQHAAEFGIDPARIAAAGGSAGGSLAASLIIPDGLDAPDEDLSLSVRPDALLLYNPGLGTTANERTGQRFGDLATWRRTAAALHVDASLPPTLLLYGTEDRLIESGRAFAAAAQAAGAINPIEWHIAEGVGHGFFNFPDHLGPTTAAVDAFLQSLGWLQATPAVPLPSGTAPLANTPDNPERGRP